MRFRAVRVENYKGIEIFEAENLRDLVVIAGPNGCGKTGVLDSVRLLKSVYGGYVLNEWQTWFGEFQMDAARPGSMQRLLRDGKRKLRISVDIELSDKEVTYLRANVDEVVRPIIWQNRLQRGVFGRRGLGGIAATEFSQFGSEVEKAVQESVAKVKQCLDSQHHSAELVIWPSGKIDVKEEPVLSVMFQTYSPQELGVIDYHSASRVYAREALGAVNLNLDQAIDRYRQFSLYNWQDKYKNVKAELASGFVLGVIAREAGTVEVPDLNKTLAELFQTFFPGKKYEGPTPQPDGTLTFPVRLDSGGRHDIDELSSGEKELLYGYLRLRNSAPRNSVILLDEPELHLNPRLLQGLPDFYHANLGKAFNNQLWLVTHSDAILRQVVGNPNYSAFHMSAPGKVRVLDGGRARNQAALVTAMSELDQAVLDIVGDLAAYKPRAKIVILEGGGATEIDVQIVGRLFSDWVQTVNLVPGGSKRRVRDLYDILETAKQRGGLSERFFAIVDRDRQAESIPLSKNVYAWDRYHIENYLLSNEHLAAAAKSILGARSSLKGEHLDQALTECAGTLVDELVLERLQDEINGALIRAINVKASPDTRGPAIDLMPSLESSLERLSSLGRQYSESFLHARESEIRSDLESALATGDWRSEFPGRLVLKRFVGRHVDGVNYKAFLNILIDKMVDSGYHPSGMWEVLSKI